MGWGRGQSPLSLSPPPGDPPPSPRRARPWCSLECRSYPLVPIYRAFVPYDRRKKRLREFYKARRKNRAPQLGRFLLGLVPCPLPSPMPHDKGRHPSDTCALYRTDGWGPVRQGYYILTGSPPFCFMTLSAHRARACALTRRWARGPRGVSTLREPPLCVVNRASWSD